jgi:ActR/RegA family two-component response regulator
MSSEKLPNLLIVEDDRALQKQMRWAFDQYETLTADDRESALAQIRRYPATGGDHGPRLAAGRRFRLRGIQTA